LNFDLQVRSVLCKHIWGAGAKHRILLM